MPADNAAASSRREVAGRLPPKRLERFPAGSRPGNDNGGARQWVSGLGIALPWSVLSRLAHSRAQALLMAPRLW